MTHPTVDLGTAISTYAALLHTHRLVLDGLNVYPVPDGDTGTNMAGTLDTVAEHLAAADATAANDDVTNETTAAQRHADRCAAIGRGAILGARGNSGVIIGQLLRAWSAQLADTPAPEAARVAAALMAGSEAADTAVHTPVEGTILSVARAAAQAGVACAEQVGPATDEPATDGRADVVAVLEAAKQAGQRALEFTPRQLPALAQAGVVDAGAAGYLLFIDALLTATDARPTPDEIDLPPDVWSALATGEDAAPASNGNDDGAHQASETAGASPASSSQANPDLGPRYEVMFLLDAPDDEVPGFTATWGTLGESIVTVGGDGIWNCHIHTDHIGPAIEAGIAIGRPHRIAVTDLHEQVAHIEPDHVRAHAAGAATSPAAPAPAATPAATGPAATSPAAVCAVVAVSPASGTDRLFTDSGVSAIVTGGQTMNPSTAELLAAVEAANATSVVVLPNNSNIVAEADQLDELTDVSVDVVPTNSVIEGLAAMVAYEPTREAAANHDAMSQAHANLAVAEVTRAVRDTATGTGTGTSTGDDDAHQVKAGDWIGLAKAVKGRIVGIGASQSDAAIETLDHLLTAEHELLTIVTGADVEADAVERVVAWLTDAHPTLEVEVLEGGQPHYPFQFGAE